MVNKTVVELSMKPIFGNKAIIPRHLISGDETMYSCISSVHPAGATDPCRSVSLTVVQIGKTNGDGAGESGPGPNPTPIHLPLLSLDPTSSGSVVHV